MGLIFSWNFHPFDFAVKYELHMVSWDHSLSVQCWIDATWPDAVKDGISCKRMQIKTEKCMRFLLDDDIGNTSQSCFALVSTDVSFTTKANRKILKHHLADAVYPKWHEEHGVLGFSNSRWLGHYHYWVFQASFKCFSFKLAYIICITIWVKRLTFSKSHIWNN